MRAAASRPAGPEALRRSFHEARCALEATALDNGESPEVASWRDLGAFTLLLSVSGRRGAEALLRQTVLGPIEDGDAEYGGELLRSLEAFIEQNGQWERAAREVYCHRHTLRYRMRKVEELTGRDLSHARTTGSSSGWRCGRGSWSREGRGPRRGGTIAPAIVRDLAGLGGGRLDPAARPRSGRGRRAGRRRAWRRQGERPRGGRARRARGGDRRTATSWSTRRATGSTSTRCGPASRPACHYLDLGGLYHVTGEQLAADGERFEAAGLLAILGIGSSPGKTNLMAARAVDRARRRGRLDRRLRRGPRPRSARRASASPTRCETLIDELTLPPVVLRDGEPVEVEPLSDGGEVDFGEPIGDARDDLHAALRASHLRRELRLPASAASGSRSRRRCSRRLRELDRRRRPSEVREAGREAGRQSSQTVSVHVVDAAGGGRIGAVRAVTPPHAEWGLGGGIVSTAVAGGGRGAADRARRDQRPRRAAARALPRPRGDVRRAGDPRLSLRIGRQGGERRMKVGVPNGDQGRRVPGRAHAGRRPRDGRARPRGADRGSGAGEGSAIPDADYEAQGARIAARRRPRSSARRR